ncbi:unnamed protein product, partial [Discosporangium mesarthrocarpum]
PVLPIVFFHGVSPGLFAYIKVVWKTCMDRTAIIVETPSISMKLHLLRGHSPLTEEGLVETVDGIMERHGINRALFFGHSFGSIPVAWMSRHRPKAVAQVALLDPVCLLLFLPDVARTFLYPEDFTTLPTVEKLVRNMVSKETGIAHTLRRHFWWYQNILWPEDLHCPAVVGLAGGDKVAPAKALRRYLLSWHEHARNAWSR